MSKKTRIALSIVVVIVAVIMSIGLYIDWTFNKIIVPSSSGGNKKPPISDKDNKNNKGDNDNKIDDVINEEDIDYKEVEGITNILLLGIDDRGDNDGYRADAVMILTVDSIHKKLKLSSILRDAYLEVPGKGYTKFAHAANYGGIRGIQNVIEHNFGIKLDKYVEIDFNGFKSVVDSVDGIDVNIKNYNMLNELNRCLLLEKRENPNFENEKFKEIVDKGKLLVPKELGAKFLKDNKRISEEEYEYVSRVGDFIDHDGDIHLNGDQALAYVRMRHSVGGSYGRTSRHRESINKVIDKLKDTSIIKYPFVMNSLIDYIQTNLEKDEIINLAYTAYKIGDFNIEQMQIPPNKLHEGATWDKEFFFDYNGNLWAMAFDIDTTKEALHEFIFDDITFNPSNYNQFKASSMGIYRPKPKEEKVEEDTENEATDENKDSNTQEQTEEGNNQNEDSQTEENAKQNQGQDEVKDENVEKSDKEDNSQESVEQKQGSEENDQNIEEESSDNNIEQNENEQNTEGNTEENVNENQNEGGASEDEGTEETKNENTNNEVDEQNNN